MFSASSFLSYLKSKFRAADINAGWSSPVARQAHNLKVVGSNPTPATNKIADSKFYYFISNTVTIIPRIHRKK